MAGRGSDSGSSEVKNWVKFESDEVNRFKPVRADLASSSKVRLVWTIQVNL